MQVPSAWQQQASMVEDGAGPYCAPAAWTLHDYNYQAVGRSAAVAMTPPTDDNDTSQHTTVMIRSLPQSYTRQTLLELLDAEGFSGRYDFVYLPIDFTSAVNLGYCFINALTPVD